MFNTKPVSTREEGLRNLQRAYAVPAEGWTLNQDSIILQDGRCVPLLPWRTHFHTISLLPFTRGSGINSNAANGSAAIHSAAMYNPCVIRSQYAGSEPLETMLKRELDLAEFYLDTDITHIFAMQHGNALYVTAGMEQGILCTIDLHALLPAGSKPVYRHELITRSGFVTDRAVDTQIVPESMYLLNSDGVTPYTETDMYTYGLDAKDATDVRAALAILSGLVDPDDYMTAEKHLNELCGLVWQSVKYGKRFPVTGGRMR